MKKLLSVILMSALLLPLCGCGFSIDFGGNIYPDAEKYSVGDAELTGEIRGLDIDWISGKVVFEFHDADTVKISETCNTELDDDHRLHYFLDGTTLRVKYSASRFKMTVASAGSQKTLTVTLPRKLTLEKLVVSGASADIDFTDVAANVVDISTSSGNISATLPKCDDVEADSSSGKITLTLASVSSCSLESSSGTIRLGCEGEIGELDIDSSSGSVTAEVGRVRDAKIKTSSGKIAFDASVTPDKCELDSSSGSVSVFLPQDAQFTADIDTASGDFFCAFATVKKGDRYICGDGSAELSVETSSGSIFIGKK